MCLRWKDKYFHAALGFEHTEWGSDGDIRCGSSVQASCRDLARAAQLWANDGFWPGYGQLMSREYAVQGDSRLPLAPLPAAYHCPLVELDARRVWNGEDCIIA